MAQLHHAKRSSLGCKDGLSATEVRPTQKRTEKRDVRTTSAENNDPKRKLTRLTTFSDDAKDLDRRCSLRP